MGTIFRAVPWRCLFLNCLGPWSSLKLPTGVICALGLFGILVVRWLPLIVVNSSSTCQCAGPMDCWAIVLSDFFLAAFFDLVSAAPKDSRSFTSNSAHMRIHESGRFFFCP
ncbi:hypothetical protein C8R47DRAFT_1158729 [Mycena vitilis]|nr:hypothetical protein C8R47DRAFT_1158729 [Mycena vitilis]